MIQIKNIVKDYVMGDTQVHALKGVSLNFRNNEFVSILGPSGCGKTTLLNIIGGLDHYTSGDLLVNNISTKEYKDRDWDSYRNHSVGFVFQSYNLISHQSVLQNVEIALTLSGVSKAERRSRAIDALVKVGLGDQLHKKPTEMSGGQMQRVAIARAIVNNPDIVLADEPTGALDTETSVQVMEILKEISKDRLVVMVTHNPDLAEEYSTRIIRMIDGNIIDDTKPYAEENFKRAEKKELKKEENVLETLPKKVKKQKTRKPTMSFWTAFKLSLKNLFTKKGRTMLTSFAGSIGIIGIALILAVSQGTTGYINYVQESTLASYPLTIEEETIDLTSLMTSFMNVSANNEPNHELDKIYKDQVMAEMVEALGNVETNENDLKSFKTYLEQELNKEDSKLKDAISGIQYQYDLELGIYSKDQNGEIFKSDTGKLLSEFIIKTMTFDGTNNSNSSEDNQTSGLSANGTSSGMFKLNLWQEMLPGVKDTEIINKIIYDQYDLIDGSWPNDYDEVVLIVNEYNELSDLTLYALGLISEEDMDAIIEAAKNKTPLQDDNKSWTYDEIKSLTFKTILPSDCYQKFGDIYVDRTNTSSMFDKTVLENLYNNGIELKIKGIIRPKKDVDSPMLQSGIGYTSLLTEYVIDKAKNSDVVKAQLSSPDVNVLTGELFKSTTGTLNNVQKQEKFLEYVDKLNKSSKVNTFIAIKSLIPEEELKSRTEAMLSAENLDERDERISFVSSILEYTMEEEIDPVVLQSYFEEMSDEQVYALAYSICEANIKIQQNSMIKNHYLAVDEGTKQRVYSDDQLITMLNDMLANASADDCAWYYDSVTVFSEDSYEEVLVKIGCLDIDSPNSINIYANSFEHKDVILAEIERYNSNVTEEKKISYTDYIGLLMSSVTTIIDAITYVLIAFVSISLIVSSIMIGVITLISVQERTKEIGILRAIGASKRDVSSMFNAETLIIGFTSGLTGVLVTYLLCIPINLILRALTGIAQLQAVLPIGAAIILILISMSLTLISGIIPSRSAAKKDPVTALRSE